MDAPVPEISVLVATHQRRERLRACLGALARQSVDPSRFEVVVSVDGSTDGTAEMLAELETPFALRPLVHEQVGQGPNLNLAIEAAAAPLVLVLDDDMTAAPELVAAHLQAQTAGPIAAIGHIDRALPPRADRFARHSARQWAQHYERLRTRPARARDCYSGNVSFPLAALETVGGFAPDVPVEKDIDLALRLARTGLSFVYVPEAAATEYQDKDWRAICREAERRGAQGLALVRRYPEQLPESRLGGHESFGRRGVLARRALIRLGVPPTALAAAGRVLPGRVAARAFDFTFSVAYWSGVRQAADDDTWRRLQRGTTILLYHAVGDGGERASRYLVPARRLASQLRWLRRRGYAVISLEDYLATRRKGELPPARSVVLTFDDGYVDNVALLRPLLEREGMTATVFAVTAAGAANGWSRSGLAGRPLLSLAAMAEADGDTLRFAAHTRTHPRLTDVPAEAARAELEGSRRDLEQALGRPVDALAYPYGASDEAVRTLAAESGFALACTIRPGRNRPATDALALNRVEIHGTDRLPRFALALWLGRRR
jgi:peptidoglycan/xylan/chitin deacetylase (PgdA/CDA1 family)/glycosyltransferase involved in cell wall biosynthesis